MLSSGYYCAIIALDIIGISNGALGAVLSMVYWGASGSASLYAIVFASPLRSLMLWPQDKAM